MSEHVDNLRAIAVGLSQDPVSKKKKGDLVLAAADRLEELEAIVARLPMTADGCVVDTSRRFVLFNKQGYMGSPYFDPEIGWAVWPTCKLGLRRPINDDEHWPQPIEYCYSTREAAEAARE